MHHLHLKRENSEMRQSKLKVEQEASSAAGMKGGQEEQQASSPLSMARLCLDLGRAEVLRSSVSPTLDA